MKRRLLHKASVNSMCLADLLQDVHLMDVPALFSKDMVGTDVECLLLNMSLKYFLFIAELWISGQRAYLLQLGINPLVSHYVKYY